MKAILKEIVPVIPSTWSLPNTARMLHPHEEFSPRNRSNLANQSTLHQRRRHLLYRFRS